MNQKLKIFLISLLISILLSVIIITTLKLLKNNQNNEETSSYSATAVTIMKELNLYDEINNKDYSKTIEVLLENNNLEPQYLDEYYQINYTNITNFSTIINNLLAKNLLIWK